jgi:hypothetical protein
MKYGIVPTKGVVWSESHLKERLSLDGPKNILKSRREVMTTVEEFLKPEV